MGTTYTATFTTRCSKQHHCIACEARYSYVLVREIKGTGASESAASAAADAAARTSIEHDVDMHACPQCGVVQPDMIGPVHRKRLTIAAAVGVVGIIVALIVGAAEGATIVRSAWIATASAAAALLLALWGVFYNPNGNLAANKSASEQKVRSSQLRLDEKGYASSSLADPPRASRAMLSGGLGLVVAAMIAAAAPPTLVALNGWTTNTACHPEIVGPGDEVRFYLPTKISAVNGMYNGSAQANATEIGVAGAPKVPLTAVSEKDTWGDTISGKNVSNSEVALRADVTFPADPRLADKKVKVDMQVTAQYPQATGQMFGVRQATGNHSADVALASVGAGKTFKTAWWGGQTAAILLIAAAWVLWRMASTGLVRQAHPTRVAPAGA